jgi:hypothetical protein
MTVGLEWYIRDPMKILAYIGISISSVIAGATAGGICGLLLGWLLALGYHRHGPSDPADAPAYVAIDCILRAISEKT